MNSDRYALIALIPDGASLADDDTEQAEAFVTIEDSQEPRTRLEARLSNKSSRIRSFSDDETRARGQDFRETRVGLKHVPFDLGKLLQDRLDSSLLAGPR